VERFRDSLPIKFGPRSFTVDTGVYAHPGSVVIATAANPLNRRFAMVVLAGLSAESTWQTPEKLRSGLGTAPVMLFPANGKPRALVVPARELVREWKAEP